MAGVEVEADERLRFDVLLLFDFTFEFSSLPDLFFFFFLDLAFFSVYLKTKLQFVSNVVKLNLVLHTQNKSGLCLTLKR